MTDAGGFLVDLWELVDCTFCGALAGELCVTKSGTPTTRSHSPRVVWVEEGSEQP